MTSTTQPFSPPSSFQSAPAKWRTQTAVTSADETLAAACDISPVLAAILRWRGYSDSETVRRFLAPDESALRDPFTLPDIEPAITRLHLAIESGEPLLIFGDYDVDGVTSTALLVRSLRLLKANVHYALPERADGYGLNNAVVKNAAEQGIKLIFTADCGITAHEPARLARQLGVDLIITDHHDPAATLPEALAVIDPKRADSQYGFGGLSGCGVAYKVIQALLSRYWPEYLPSFTQKYLDLVAVAAIADCVPLVDENRYLAWAGLKVLSRTKKKGLLALMDAAKIDVAKQALAGHHVGFRLGPRLNAAGRMASATRSLELLLCDDADESMMLAAELDQLNTERQNATREIIKSACEVVYRSTELQQQAILIVDGEGWPHGLIGLAASRLVETFYRPAIVLGVEEELARGSGRSYADFDLHALIEHTAHLLESGGGHKAACGLSIHPAKINEFRELAQQFAKSTIDAELLTPVVEADCLTEGKDITPELVKSLEALEPCGTGNPEASLMLKNAVLVDGLAMGQQKQHLKWFVEAGGRRFECVWWNPGKKADGFAPGQKIDICYVPQLNQWGYNTTLQLVLKAVRRSE
jgi:single-stranded-DNA-specific exonuclease